MNHCTTKDCNSWAIEASWCCNENRDCTTCRKCTSYKSVPVKINTINKEKEDTHFDKKFDKGKPRFDLLDPYFEEEIARVLEFGALKYSANSWQDVPDAMNRYIAAMRRHLCAIQKGELTDQDSGLPHSAHMSCNAMFISYFTRKLTSPE